MVSPQPEQGRLANTLLSRVREKLQQSAEKVLKKVQAVLLKPEVKQAGKEQIKNKARKSIMAFLISPMGLPLAAIWLLSKVQSLKFAIQDWVYG